MKILWPLSCLDAEVAIPEDKPWLKYSLPNPPPRFILEDTRLPAIRLPYGLKIIGGGAPNCPVLFVHAEMEELVLLRIVPRVKQFDFIDDLLHVTLPQKIEAEDIYIGHAWDNTRYGEIQILIATQQEVWATVVGRRGCHKPWTSASTLGFDKFENIAMRAGIVYLLSCSKVLSMVTWISTGINIEELNIDGSNVRRLNRFTRTWLVSDDTRPEVMCLTYTSDRIHGRFSAFVLKTDCNGRMYWAEFAIGNDCAIFFSWSRPLPAFGCSQLRALAVDGGLLYCSMYASPGKEIMAYRIQEPYRSGRQYGLEEREVRLPTHAVPWPFRIWINLDRNVSRVCTLDDAE